MEKLGPVVWRGGETEALVCLDRHLERKVKEVIGPSSYYGNLLLAEVFDKI